MKVTPLTIPANEAQRLESLRALQILDTAPEEAFDDLTQLAAQLCGTPIALISLVDETRQWFKSKSGLGVSETPREFSFCAHAIHGEGILQVADARRDPRFRENPLVTGDPNIRFYAGAPLAVEAGLPLGTLCVIDSKPRTLTEEQSRSLTRLARLVSAQLRARVQNFELARVIGEIEKNNYRKAAHLAVTEILSTAPNVQEAALPLLKTLADYGGWHLAEMWLMDPAADGLKLEAIWSAKLPTLEELERQSRSVILRLGEGLPGAVLEEGEPRWYPDLADVPFTRQALADSGLQSALLLPLRQHQQTFGVLAFFSRNKRNRDEDTLAFTTDFGRRISSFIDRRDSEKKARENETKFRALTEEALHGVLIHDWNRILFVNQYVCDVTGYTEREVLRMQIRDLLHPEDVALVEGRAMRCLAGEPQDDTTEFRVRTRSGEYRWIDSRGKLIPLAGENVVLTSCVDVTDRKQVQAALHESEEKYRNLVDNSLGYICTHTLDGTLLSVNPSACHALGFPRDAWHGRKIQDLMHPDSRANFDGYLSRLLERGQDADDMRVLRADGTVRIWSYQNTLIQEEGREPYVLGHAQDTTEQKRAETIIRESEEKYRDLFDNALELIQSIAPDGRFLYVNPAWKRALCYSEEELAGLTAADIVAPEEREQNAELFRQVLAGVNIGKIETIFVDKNGTRINVEGSTSLRVGLDGKPESTRGIFHDITLRKIAEESAKRAQERLRAALEKEKETSRRDFLTQVSNRRAFFESGEYEAARSRRYGRPVSLAYIDLDNFKRVNDTLGHEVGDDLLVVVASAIQANMRQTDIIARLGGDEFAVLLPETEAEAARNVMTKLQAILLESMRSNGWDVTFSIGLMTFQEYAGNFEDMIREADRVMYSVKKDGKNRVACAVAGQG